MRGIKIQMQFVQATKMDICFSFHDKKNYFRFETQYYTNILEYVNLLTF